MSTGLKSKPQYALRSVDHALQLAVILQVEGPQTVSDVADRLGVARSTAHRLLTMLVYRDFARQGPDRRYHAGPVISLEADSRSHTALLRAVALPHLQVLVGRVDESANLMVLAGDHARFVASVESSQSLRVGNREGMVFPAHLASGGKTMLADLPPEDLAELYSDTRWDGREGERPDLAAVEKDLAAVRRRGFAINKDRTETGVTAIGRGVRVGTRTDAAVTVSMPTVRFRENRLVDLVSALALAARDIERDMEQALRADA
ncbi:IclR family transcriptional regulator [Intrasporangium sp. YIM S08009]|uniref:IclR family transcriptional regulator n=1 Tax=Intrasporangium zincisolvens TaxID=3080018 RepID=UPI002B05C66F|nr:IclR family transcriptional regulator [Intrasporangium sp. YIM S08009]